MTDLKQKAIDCLTLASMNPKNSPERGDFYFELCARYSEKAVIRKLEELTDRGYVDYGVSPRLAWLTEKGEEALRDAVQV
jgi:hypothetical protein